MPLAIQAGLLMTQVTSPTLYSVRDMTSLAYKAISGDWLWLFTRDYLVVSEARLLYTVCELILKIWPNRSCKTYAVLFYFICL